jgi:hypothetical protein
MIPDEKEAELRNVYNEMDEDRREKMEFLAVNLLNAQKAAESGEKPAAAKQKTPPK